jgi:hypothetical protein
MADTPDEVLTAAAVAIHDVDCPDTHCSGSALGHCYRLAEAALNAATPLITAAERHRIRELAWMHNATYSVACHDEDCRNARHYVSFAHLLDGDSRG